jgi:hypothetical protein
MTQAPDILAGLRRLIGDDAAAITYQTMGQYRGALIGEFNKVNQALAAAPLPAAPAADRAVSELSDERLLHLWDSLVGEPTASLPLKDCDKLHFARAVIKVDRVLARSTDAPSEPIDMVLFCPKCGTQHIDDVEGGQEVQPDGTVHAELTWENPPHRSHLCHGCEHVWRPADVPTNGVATVKTTGKADSPLATPPAAATSDEPTEQVLDAACLRHTQALQAGLTSRMAMRRALQAAATSTPCASGEAKFIACPFCGGSVSEHDRDGADHFRFCWHCRASGPRKPTAQEALAAWGTRAATQAPATSQRFDLAKLSAEFEGAGDDIDCAGRAVPATDARAERTLVDYALEHAEYLATAAEGLSDACGKLALAEQRRDEADEDDDHEALVASAREDVDEAMRAVRDRVYGFRTRRDRAALTQAASTGGKS